jgi:hypothetical protein
MKPFVQATRWHGFVGTGTERGTVSIVAPIDTDRISPGRRGAEEVAKKISRMCAGLTTVLPPRAILVVSHARDRRKLGRIIDPASGIALARHAGAAVAGIGTLAVSSPRPIGMILADQPVLSQTEHAMSYK